MNEEINAEEKRDRILKLNVFQTWLIIIGTLMGIGTAAAAWASGWLGLPERVKAIEEGQKPVTTITNRIVNLEMEQRQIILDNRQDHDLLIKMDQKLTDLKDSVKELKK